MAANEFEKNVRREMDEFKLHPSGDVWVKVEERIRERRRKRRVLFFILFSSMALLLGGYGIYNFSGNETKSQVQNKLPGTNRSNDESNIDNSKNKELNKETIAIKPTIPGENSKQANTTPLVTGQKPASQPADGDRHVAFVPQRSAVSHKVDRATPSKTQEKQTDDVANNVTSRSNASSCSSNPQQTITDNSQDEAIKVDGNNLTHSDTTGSKLEQSKDTKAIQVVNKKKADNVSNKIIWGINFSAGSSVITENAFSFKGAYPAADRQSNPPGTSVGGGGPLTGGGGSGAYNYYPQSQNKPAFAFKAGVTARKNISKRSSLSAGLGYTYLADKIQVGTTQASAQSFSALYYYYGSPQQTHTDHFHFIELPLSYNWRVTNNADRFLSLSAGVSPSYLFATNALVYDTSMGGIYYHNKNLVAKAHFNFISGVSYQFKNKKNLEFVVGPQFSFDITKAFKTDLDKRKYFLYTGIGVSMFFEKKKKQ